MLPHAVERESQQLGFFQFIPAALTAVVQLKAQSDARKLEMAKIKALQAAQAAQASRSAGDFLGGMSPLTLGILIGAPVLAFLLLRK